MNNRQQLLEALQAHQPFDANEAAMLQQMIQFVEDSPLAYSRENLAGHITASAWIVNPAFDQVLMLHHAKLNKWLQPGGHADGNENLFEVVKSELEEETGIAGIADPQLFDIDIHAIPARGEVPEHLHYDVRFLVVVSADQAFMRNEESNDLNWFPLQDILKLNGESSIARMVNRTYQLQTQTL